MEFCDYANEEGTWGLCDPNMEENTDELNHRQQRQVHMWDDWDTTASSIRKPL